MVTVSDASVPFLMFVKMADLACGAQNSAKITYYPKITSEWNNVDSHSRPYTGEILKNYTKIIQYLLQNWTILKL